MYACNGACVAGADGKTKALAQRALTTPQGNGFVLLGSLTYDSRARGLRSFTSYQWQPTTASGNTNQIYRLDEVPQPLQSLSAGVFLTYRFGLGGWGAFGIGGGPSVLFGDGGGHLTEWTANWFFSPWGRDSRVFLTGGFGFRLYDKPLVAIEGQYVQAMTAPSVVTTSSAEMVLTFGLAFDLSVIGDAASSLYGVKTTSATKDN